MPISITIRIEAETAVSTKVAPESPRVAGLVRSDPSPWAALRQQAGRPIYADSPLITSHIFPIGLFRFITVAPFGSPGREA